MSRLLLDTHAWVWSLVRSSALSEAARQAVANAEAVFTSAICAYEIAQKVRLGKWPDMDDEMLIDMIASTEARISILPLDVQTGREAGLLDWSNRDPFDRMVAATAMRNGLTLVTKDEAFGRIGGLDTLW